MFPAAYSLLFLRFVFDWLSMPDEECTEASDDKKATFNFSSPSEFKQARLRELEIRFKTKDGDASYRDAGVPTEADLVKKVRKEVLSMARTVAANTPDVTVAGKRSGDVHFDPESELKKRKKSRKIQNPKIMALESGHLNFRQLQVQREWGSLWYHEQFPTERIIQDNPYLLPSSEELVIEPLQSRWFEHRLPHHTNFNRFTRANDQHPLGNHVTPLNLSQSMMASNKITLRALLSSGSCNSSLTSLPMTMAASRSQNTSFSCRGRINPFVSNQTSWDEIPTSTSYGRSPAYLAILRQILGPSCRHFIDSNGVSAESRLPF